MKMEDIKSQNDKELAELVTSQREALRSERFKDRMSRKASVIRGAKKAVAQALTELSARRRNPESK